MFDNLSLTGEKMAPWQFCGSSYPVETRRASHPIPERVCLFTFVICDYNLNDSVIAQQELLLKVSYKKINILLTNKININRVKR